MDRLAPYLILAGVGYTLYLLLQVERNTRMLPQELTDLDASIDAVKTAFDDLVAKENTGTLNQEEKDALAAMRAKLDGIREAAPAPTDGGAGGEG